MQDLEVLGSTAGEEHQMFSAGDCGGAVGYGSSSWKQRDRNELLTVAQA